MYNRVLKKNYVVVNTLGPRVKYSIKGSFIHSYTFLGLYHQERMYIEENPATLQQSVIIHR